MLCLLVAAGGWAFWSSVGQKSRQAIPAAATGRWRPAWALSLAHAGDLDGTDRTCRFIARAGQGGTQVRLRLVNYPATGPVSFSRITVGVRTHALDVDPASLREVTVAGKADTVLTAGATVLTDPVGLDVRTGDDLAISIAIRSGTSAPWHYWTSQIGACTGPRTGDLSTTAGGDAFTDRNEDRWLDQVQVLTRTPVPTVAVYGDSLTDGVYLPFDTGARWTDHLQTDTGERIVVLNYGVAGDLLTRHAPAGTEPPRLRTDVLAPAGIGAVVLEMGSNDIRAGVSARTVLDAVAVVARTVRASGAEFVVATVPPRADRMPVAAEKQRQLLNAGLRRYPVVADLDRALGDPGKARLRPAYDIGDHIHPNTQGVAVLTATMRAALARLPGEVGAAVR